METCVPHPDFLRAVDLDLTRSFNTVFTGQCIRVEKKILVAEPNWHKRCDAYKS